MQLWLSSLDSTPSRTLASYSTPSRTLARFLLQSLELEKAFAYESHHNSRCETDTIEGQHYRRLSRDSTLSPWCESQPRDCGHQQHVHLFEM